MIYVDMKGNIGNQMFIYACARKIQVITGQKICINTYNLKYKHQDYKFKLNIFSLTDNLEYSESKLPWWASTESFLYKVIKRIPFISGLIMNIIFTMMSKKNVFLWDGTTYKSLDIKKDKDIYLSGFWQSERYFSGIEDVLRSDFEVNSGISESNTSLLDKIKKCNSICLSIRRGDYVSNPKVKKFHYVCDTHYYMEALKVLIKNVENPLLICFSDDPEWVKDNMQFDIDTIYESKGNSLEDKIILMKSCKNYILSNSSFSWWIEYLCDYQKKVVVAPNIWYANKQPADIYRDYWHLIEVK